MKRARIPQPVNRRVLNHEELMQRMTKTMVMGVKTAHVTESWPQRSKHFTALCHWYPYFRDKEGEALSQSLLSVISTMCWFHGTPHNEPFTGNWLSQAGQRLWVGRCECEAKHLVNSASMKFIVQWGRGISRQIKTLQISGGELEHPSTVKT